MLTFQKDWVLNGVFPELSLEKWQKTVDIMARIFNAPAGFIVQYQDSEGYQVTISSDQDSNPYPAGNTIPVDTNIFCRKVVQSQAQLYETNAKNNPEWKDNPEVVEDGFESYLGMPILWPDGTPFGTICVMDFNITNYDEAYQALLEQFRDMVQSDLEMLETVRKLHEMSIRDVLSGLLNRRGLYMGVEHQVSIAKRHGHSFGVMVLDLDNLKIINDNHGHASGDLAIAALGQAIGGVLRDSDLAGRIGGDEFAALLFVKRAEDLSLLEGRIAEALTQVTEGSSTLHGISVSMGHVYYDHAPDMTFEDMIHAADQAMYNAKIASKVG